MGGRATAVKRTRGYRGLTARTLSPPAAPSQLFGTELALGALRAMESQFWRLVIREVGRKAILLIRPPHQSTLDTARDLNELLGGHVLSLRHPI